MIAPRHIILALALWLCGAAQAEEVVTTQIEAVEVADTITPEVIPVSRGSSGVFEAIAPLIEARIAFENEQYERSYQNYSEAFLHDTDNVDILFGLARTSLKVGKNEIAEKAYSKLFWYTLTSEQAIEQFTGLVMAEVAAGTSESPEVRLLQALKLTPYDERLWNALGQHYDTQSRWRESYSAYENARNAGLSEAGFKNNMGMSLLAQKNYKYAAVYLNEAANLAPQKTQFKNNYRFALLMMGDYRGALENAADDEAADILADAGYIAMQREDYKLARMLLQKAIDVSPRYNERADLSMEQLESRLDKVRHSESHAEAENKADNNQNAITSGNSQAQ